MISISTIIILLVIAIWLGFWSSNLRSKEIAIRAVKEACQKNNMQLLDSTTQFVRLRLKRDTDGRVKIQRIYRFEYYDGETRWEGKVILFAYRVTAIDFPNIQSGEPSSKTNVLPFHKRE